MATPMSTTSQEETGNKKLEQITFRFCSECSNMLYPKEDEETHKLQFTCRTCQFTEEAQSSCVFRNVMNNAAGETAGVTQDVGSDPTVGDSHPAVLAPVVCICCGLAILCSGCGNPSDDFVASAVVAQRTASQSKKTAITWDELMEMADEYASDEYDEEKEPGSDDEINNGFASIVLNKEPATTKQQVSWPTFQLAVNK